MLLDHGRASSRESARAAVCRGYSSVDLVSSPGRSLEPLRRLRRCRTPAPACRCQPGAPCQDTACRPGPKTRPRTRRHVHQPRSVLVTSSCGLKGVGPRHHRGGVASQRLIMGLPPFFDATPSRAGFPSTSWVLHLPGGQVLRSLPHRGVADRPCAPKRFGVWWYRAPATADAFACIGASRLGTPEGALQSRAALPSTLQPLR
jgi:hypothetical protein